MIKTLLPNTELLTQSGWKNISDITASDAVANYTSDNHRIMFSPLLSSGHKEFTADLISFRKKGKELFAISTLASVPIITKNRKGMILSTALSPEVPLNKTTNFITGGLSSSQRLIMTDYELSCLMYGDTPWSEWINYGTMSYKLADSILSRLESTPKKNKVEINSVNEGIRILLALSGKTSTQKKKSIECTETNLMSTNGVEAVPMAYKGDLFVIDTKHIGVLAKVNDTIIVL